MKRFDGSIKQIRMVYSAFSVYNGYARGTFLGETCFWSQQFNLPKGMSLNDACKIISYLSEKVEKENLIDEASLESVKQVSGILQNYGFTPVLGTQDKYLHGHGELPIFKIKSLCKKVDGVVDLITYGGEKKFKRSDLHSRYFEWFTKDVKEKEIQQIYDSSNTVLPDENVV